MDPALWEMLEEGTGEEEVRAIVRLRHDAPPPPSIRLVARFGDVATCRLRRQEIVNTRTDEAVASLKAPRPLRGEPGLTTPVQAGEALRPGDRRRPDGLAETGRGVVVGCVDWGCDFAHPNFRHPDGSTRLLALWDQSGDVQAGAPNRYGYGTIYTADAINRALQAADPYAALGYHPASGDPDDQGAHGTHVLDIAAGNGRAGGPLGIAPAADLVFVHLTKDDTGGLASLGDSVTLLEGVDFIARLAGDRPWVVNASVGAHGGPKDASTLVEQALDALVAAQPACAYVNSGGNYFKRGIHASGQLRPGQGRTLLWQTDAADRTPNELEVWYCGRDRFRVDVEAPDGERAASVALGETAPIAVDGREVGRIYHRAHDPNNLDHHVDMFLDPGAPAGAWAVTLTGVDIVDGRFHAWVERDSGCRQCQSRFGVDDEDRAYTTGTICNGLRTIAVGAYNAHQAERPLAPFSSSGPTRDGRQKPDLLAPGMRVLAARSAPEQGDAPLHTRKSGTSMAAPHVTGTIACIFEAAPRPLWIFETQSILSRTAVPAEDAPGPRAGSGYLDIEAAVAAARALAPTPEPARAEAQPVAHHSAGAELDTHKQPLEVAMNSESEPLAGDLSERQKTHNFILISGGPGLFDNRDIEHDKSWANYVTPPLLLAEKGGFAGADEAVWWLIYRPAYEARWQDDVRRKRQAVRDVRKRGFTSYVDLLEKRAQAHGWNLRWFTSATDLWRRLHSFRDPISRVYYWGHARDDLWLSLGRSGADGAAVEPAAGAIVTRASLGEHARLRARFQAASNPRRSRFVGCNTATFARRWAGVFRTRTEGVEGKVDFSAIHQTGGEPSLVAGARRKRYRPVRRRETVETVPAPTQEIAPAVAEAVAPPHEEQVWSPTALAEREQVALSLLSPAVLFDTLAHNRYPELRRAYGDWFEVVAAPGIRAESVQAGDLLVERVLGEGELARTTILDEGEGEAYLGAHRLIVRLRNGNGHFLEACAGCGEQAAPAAEAITHACRPGEGPPAAVPDPEGKGLHPLVYRGTGTRRSRNPTVGDAQQLLNRFLQEVERGAATCRDNSRATRQYLAQGLTQLKAQGQFPLDVDCRFGSSTEVATKMFQRCMGLAPDGKIGPNTWRELARFRRSTPVTPPPVVPPGNFQQLRQRYMLDTIEGDAGSLFGSQPLTPVPIHPDCQVIPLIDGAAYFRALRQTLNRLRGANQFIYLAGWWLDPHFSLDGPGGGTPLVDLLQARARAGVDVRVLGWVVAPEVASSVLLRSGLGAGGASFDPVRGLLGLNDDTIRFVSQLRRERALADKAALNILSHPAGAVHMKFALVGSDWQVDGFTGGLDFQQGRWGSGWHDVQAQVRGSVLQGFYEAFREMWNEIRGRGPVHLSALHESAASHTAAMPAVPGRTLPGSGGSTIHAQSLRTLPQFNFSAVGSTMLPTNDPLTFAPRGLFEIKAAWKKAILAAGSYVYIEDQGFTSMEADGVFEWLNSAIRRRPELRVILLKGRGDPNDPDAVRNQFVKYFARALGRLTSGLSPAQMARIAVFTHTTRVIHSKTTIVDDQWAIIGSANAMRRSLYTDFEHSVPFMDENGRAVAAYRTALWRVHLSAVPAAPGPAVDRWFAIPPGGSAGDLRRLRLPVAAVPFSRLDQIRYDELDDADSRQTWGAGILRLLPSPVPIP